MSDQVRINGNFHSWGSVIIKINGEPFTGLTEITYSDKRERVKGHGIGPHQGPRGRSRGKYTADDAKMSVYRDTGADLLASLAALSGNGLSYGDVVFPVVIQTIEPGNRPLTVTLDRCCITAANEPNQEGTDPLMTELTLDVMAIYRNKLTLWDSSRGNF